MGASADGALMTTFLAPPLMCAFAFSQVVNIPVDSTTYLTSLAPHGKLLGSRLQRLIIALCHDIKVTYYYIMLIKLHIKRSSGSP